MRNYATAILLYHFAIRAVLAANVPTFTEKASKEYIGTTANKVHVAANDIDVQDDGDLIITFGTEHSSKIAAVLKKDCKNPASDACQNNLKKAMGVDSDANGLSRRMFDPLQKRFIAVGLAFIVAAIVGVVASVYQREGEQNYKIIQVKLPKDQKEEVENWKGVGDSFKYKPTKGKPFTIKLGGPMAKPKNPPNLKKAKDGSLSVIFPGLGSTLKSILSKVVCKREETHSLDKRINTQCLLAYAKALIGAMQVGAPLEGARYINPFTEFPKPKNKLLVETITSDNTYIKSDGLWFGGDEDKDLREDEVKKRIADLSSWMAFGHAVGHLEVNGDKFSFPKSFLEKQDEEEKKKKSKCFKTPSFCVNCGGNTIKKNYETRIGKCAGVKEGALKDCPCYLDPEPNHDVTMDTVKASYEALSKLAGKTKSKPKEKTDPAATCKPGQMPPGFDAPRCSNCKDVTGGYDKNVYIAAAHQFCFGNYKWTARKDPNKNMDAHAAFTFDHVQKDPKTKLPPYCSGMTKSNVFDNSKSQKLCKSKRGYHGEDSQIRVVVLPSKSQNNCGSLQDYKLPVGDDCSKKFDAITNKCITGKDNKETGGFYLDKTGKGCYEWWILGKEIILTKEGKKEVEEKAKKTLSKIVGVKVGVTAKSGKEVVKNP